MELIKKNLHMLRQKSEAVNQVTFDEDYNVPDAKPDVGRMIQKKGGDTDRGSRRKRRPGQYPGKSEILSSVCIGFGEKENLQSERRAAHR